MDAAHFGAIGRRTQEDVDEPGPAISTFATCADAGSAPTSAWARSRGFMPAGLDISSAAFAAKSPCSLPCVRSMTKPVGMSAGTLPLRCSAASACSNWSGEKPSRGAEAEKGADCSRAASAAQARMRVCALTRCNKSLIDGDLPWLSRVHRRSPQQPLDRVPNSAVLTGLWISLLSNRPPPRRRRALVSRKSRGTRFVVRLKTIAYRRSATPFAFPGGQRGGPFSAVYNLVPGA